MKKAFTMIELVFVIVIIGILSSLISPSFQRATVKEAADQIASHIRYTQQLALNDNKFDTTDRYWFRRRWQILFANTVTGSNGKWTYTIFSDSDTINGNPQVTEIAKNPLDPKNKLLSGGYGSSIKYYSSGTTINPKITKELNLGLKYGITNILFGGGCPNGKRISFDYLGRPLQGAVKNLNKKYSYNNNNRLIQTDCTITITDGTDTEIIVITPETGYCYIQ